MSHEEGVKLLRAWASPFAIRVHVALELKGISYEIIEETMQPKSQLLLESNPVYKKIPVLFHNGKPICESAIIIQYIDEVWPENVKLFPNDPYEKAQAKFWGDFFDSKFFKALVPAYRSAKAVPQANEDIAVCFMDLEKVLSSKDGNKFFGGAEMNYVDVMFAPYAVWIAATPAEFGIEFPTQEQCPRVHKLLDAILEHPVAKIAFPSTEKLQAFMTGLFTPMRLNN